MLYAELQKKPFVELSLETAAQVLVQKTLLFLQNSSNVIPNVAKTNPKKEFYNLTILKIKYNFCRNFFSLFVLFFTIMEVNKLGMEICNISSFHISHTHTKKHPEVYKTIHERRFFNATITKVSGKLLV